MVKNKDNKKGKKGLRSWIITAMWSVVFIGVIALSSLFIMARFEILGPMPTFE